jgi:hypothetical protein
MFYDQVQKKMSRPGQKCQQVIVQRRSKSYWRWVKNEDGDFLNTQIASGWEIAKTLNTNEEGLRLWNQQRKEDAIANGFEDVEAYEKSLMIKDER